MHKVAKGAISGLIIGSTVILLGGGFTILPLAGAAVAGIAISYFMP